jgi:hypothetical protein
MNTNKLNFFEQISYAVIRPNKYYRLTKVSGGRLTGFVFLFLLVVSLFTIIPMANAMIGFNGFTKALREDLPPFDLSNGELYVGDKYEYNDGRTYVLIDTNVDQFSTEDVAEYYDQVLLISRTNLINFQSYGRSQEINFQDLNNLHLDNNIVNYLIPFIYILLIMIIIFVYLFMVAGYYISALIYSLIGLFVSSVSRANLTYSAIFKATIYSKVTITFLVAFVESTGLIIPGFLEFSLSLIVTCLYLVFGILSHTTEEAYEEAGLKKPPFIH